MQLLRFEGVHCFMNRRYVQRWFASVIALLWCVTSVLAPAYATQTLAASLGDHHHPALDMTTLDDANENSSSAQKIIVVDIATFWSVVDDFDGQSDCKLACMSTAAALPTTHLAPRFESLQTAPLAFEQNAVSFIPAVEPPPPRGR